MPARMYANARRDGGGRLQRRRACLINNDCVSQLCKARMCAVPRPLALDFAAPVEAVLPDHSANDLVAGDFNGDQIVDLAVADTYGNVELLRGVGDGTFGSATVHPSGAIPLQIATYDFDGDGRG